MKLLLHPSGSSFFVKDCSKDYHTQYGFIKVADLKKKSGSIVKTNTGKEMTILDPSFIDLYKKIKRAPQIIPRKDVGIIIAETGLQRDWKVVDAGAGSGALTIFLSQYVKSIVSYEIRADFLNVVTKNLDFLDIKNVKIKNKDIYKGISEKNLDMITLDLPEPWLAIKHAEKALKPGGFLVSYSPTIPQVMDFVEAVNKSKLQYLKTVEIILREWDIDKRKVRPKSTSIGHSGIISFARR